MTTGEKIHAVAALGRALQVRKPDSSDGAAVHALVAACPPLDRNSLYFDLIQCSHFADTCCIAHIDGQVAGFVSGHVMPRASDTLFIWQVAVDPAARGMGLAAHLILEIAARPECQAVSRIVATITPDNAASWALFKGVADKLATVFTTETYFDKDRHFGGRHDSEDAIVIGPYAADAPARAVAQSRKKMEERLQ